MLYLISGASASGKKTIGPRVAPGIRVLARYDVLIGGIDIHGVIAKYRSLSIAAFPLPA